MLKAGEGSGQSVSEGLGCYGGCEPDPGLLADEFDETIRGRSGDDGQACGGGLEQSIGKALMARGEDKERGGGKPRFGIGDMTKEADCAVKREGVAENLQRGFFRAGAEDQEACFRKSLSDEEERL